MKRTRPTRDIKVGDHVSLFYDAPEQRWQLLAEYFRDGFERHELCVFVSQATPRQAVAYFWEAGLDVEPYIERQQLCIFNMEATYLPEGRFVADYMLHNVTSFIEDAQAQGYQGLRTAGEMNWLADRPTFQQEAAVYESDVNHLSESHPTFTGLCLYGVRSESLASIKQSLRTHPVFIYEGQLHHNPYYMAPEHFLQFLAGELSDRRRASWLYDREALTYPLTPADQAIKKLFAKVAAT